MPNPINLNNLAAQTDFSSITDNNVAQLLNQNRPGRLTLDSQGNLAVVTVPQTRDNGFVRFIKGLFSSSYREQQKQLDRLPLLEQNAAFSRQILDKLLGLKNVANEVRPQLVSTALELTAKIQGRGPLTLESLHAATQVSAMSEQVNSSVQAGFYASHGRAVPVMVGSQPLELGTFLENYGAKELNTGNTLRNICMQAMKGMNTEECGLLTNEEQREMVGLLARPASSQQPGYQKSIDVLMTRISTNLATKLAQFANEALKAKADPTAVADQVRQCLSTLASSQNANEVLSGLDPQAVAQQHPANALPENNPQGKLEGNPRPQANQADPINAARLEMMVAGLKLSSEEQALALSLHKNMSELLKSTKEMSTEITSPDSTSMMCQLSKIVEEAGGKNIKEDRLPLIYEAALFQGMLDGLFAKQTPDRASLLIGCCTQLMKNTESVFLAGANKSSHPINILLSSAKVMRDKIHPLLACGTMGGPIKQAEVTSKSSYISKLNIHAHLSNAVDEYLEKRLAFDPEANKKELAEIMRRNMNVDIRADTKMLPDEDRLETYFIKAKVNHDTPVRSILQKLIDSTSSTPIKLDVLHETLWNIENKGTVLTKTKNAIEGDSELNTILTNEFKSIPEDARKSCYTKLMNDNLVSQYYSCMLRIRLAGFDVYRHNPNSLMYSKEIASCTNQAILLENVMLALEASLGLDKKDEHGQLPSMQRLEKTNVSKHTESIISLPVNFLKKFNLEGDLIIHKAVESDDK